jgi:GNAT superfamily N-acetyltransferase
MKNTKVSLLPLAADDREQFIIDNQWAFKHGALMEFGERDDHVDGDGEIISRATIERCIDAPQSETYRIMLDGKKVGGLILTIDKKTHHNHLDILFVLPEAHSKGIGYGAWQAVEALHPETRVWETCTPYFEKRNIHFYVNKCGFQIDQFWCEYFQPEHEIPESEKHDPNEGPDEMFRFIKVMKP